MFESFPFGLVFFRLKPIIDDSLELWTSDFNVFHISAYAMLLGRQQLLGKENPCRCQIPWPGWVCARAHNGGRGAGFHMAPMCVSMAFQNQNFSQFQFGKNMGFPKQSKSSHQLNTLPAGPGLRRTLSEPRRQRGAFLASGWAIGGAPQLQWQTKAGDGGDTNWMQFEV